MWWSVTGQSSHSECDGMGAWQRMEWGSKRSPSGEVLTRVLHVFLPSEGTAGEADER